MEPWRAVEVYFGGVEALNEPWRVCCPVVANSHHFDEEQKTYPDPDQYSGEKLDSDPDSHPIKSEKLIINRILF
jgi:hypothetical protein